MSFSQRAAVMLDDQERALEKHARRARKAAQEASASIKAQLSSSHPYSLAKHPAGGTEWRLFTPQHMREIAALDMGIVAGAVGVDAWRKASERVDGQHGALPPPASISRRTYGRYFA